jgi:polyisoprenyl-teichoic acid--peptidoglycan teichoic acid transferase
MNTLTNIKFRRPRTGELIFWVIAILIAVGIFIFIRGLVTCWIITPLPGVTPANCGTLSGGGLTEPTINEQGTPIAPVVDLPPAISIPDSDLPPAWDGASRITVLLIGLDYRDYVANEGPPRSDTMILLTIDPLTKSAGMLSIPRDMWVNIPGFEYGRINMAYFFGEGSKLPGGGPELARKTVEQFIGVPIQYYAQIDFNTFVEFIDLIGGIDIDNQEELRLDPVGHARDKIKLTCCGIRHLNGEKALAYVRFRKDKEGDVGRSQRQQKAIIAIRNKVLSPENFPVLLGQAQQFYEEFSAGIKTNMPLDVALQLGVLAKDIPLESIKQGVIDYTMVALDNTTLGGEAASVMKPLPDKIRELRDQIFTTGGAVSPLASQGDPVALMQADASRVRIVNGSFSPGLDNTTGQYLLSRGVQVTEVGTADRAYDQTTVILYAPKLYTLKYLQAVFGISSSTQIVIRPDPTSTVDIEVRLGNDWANNHPMP